MTRRALRFGLGLFALLTLCGSVWTLAQNPFAQPFAARSTAELRASLDHAFDRQLTPLSVAARVDEALARGEADEAAAILRLADGRGVAIPDDLRARVAEAEAQTKGIRACLACAFDPTACADLAQVAQCNLPLELTPIGDAMAVNRALEATLTGAPVDRIDLSLGLVGLGATGALVVTGGSSATLRAGATALRVARRTGALTGTLARELGGLARRALRPSDVGDVVAGRKTLASLAGSPAMTVLSGAAGDLGRLAGTMSPGDSLAVLRHAGSTGELARIARVAEATGNDTRATFAILGKARVLRAAYRLTDLALMTIAFLAALAGQVLAFLLWWVRRVLRPTRARRAFQTESGRLS